MLRRSITTMLVIAAAAALWAPGATAQSSPAQGPGGPVLVVANPGDPFGTYYAEILRAEGLNEFAVTGVANVNAATLSGYQVVVLARTALNDAQASALAGWVEGGGNLIAMRPDARLAGLLGLGADTGDLAEGYVKVASGAGVTSATMQFHGVADRWTLAGAEPVATLYSNATTATSSPAVTLRSVGSAGGQAAAFTYDLARSVVYTRQGNPDRAGVDWSPEPAGGPIRSNDMFFPDWLDFSKVTIPQADEQQRLLANLITQMNSDRMPLPRFWYLPRGEKAAVVMTGDDHDSVGGTAGQFERFKAASPAGCSVADWECIRSTSYVYPGTSITDPEAAGYQAAGFEIALHVLTGCADYTADSLDFSWQSQLSSFTGSWPSLAAPRTNRTHCVPWSDWATQPKVELAHGVRLDTNYYYFPGSWVQDRPGLFTGSGMPMRFADENGSIIDVYQAATQLTDEWADSVPGGDMAKHIAALLDGALGPNGYYGVFTANMHTDFANHPGANAIVAAAKARGVPVVSAMQMLDWLDGRNGSSFQGLSYAGGQLRFSVAAAAGSRGLEAMLPVAGPSGPLQGLTRGGAAVATSTRTVKGIQYAVFAAAGGDYVATYGTQTPPGGGPPTGTPPGTSPGGKTAKAARVVGSRRIRVGAGGKLSLRVTCPRERPKCRVQLRLRLGKRYVASKTLALKSGQTRRFKLVLNRATRRKLSRERSLKVTAVARDRVSGRTSNRKLVLLAPKPRR